MKHSSCYMVWGGDLVSNQQTRFSQEDMVVGCLVDLATGLMTFTANGKEINTFYQVGTCPHCSSFATLEFQLVLRRNITPEPFGFRWSPTPNCSLLSSFSRPTRTWCSWNWANSRLQTALCLFLSASKLKHIYTVRGLRYGGLKVPK